VKRRRRETKSGRHGTALPNRAGCASSFCLIFEIQENILSEVKRER